VHAVIALLAIGQAAKLEPVQIQLKDVARHDGRSVAVEGKVKRYQARVSKRDNPYATFVLVDGKSEVNVYLRAHVLPALKDGERVRVTGVYRKVKRVGTRTFKNEIEAKTEAGKPVGVRRLSAKR
jgi:hypothetical protein